MCTRNGIAKKKERGKIHNEGIMIIKGKNCTIIEKRFTFCDKQE